MHQAGGEIPSSDLGAQLSKPVSQRGAPTFLANPAWSTKEPPPKGVTPHLDANLGTRKIRGWGCPPMQRDYQYVACRGH